MKSVVIAVLLLLTPHLCGAVPEPVEGAARVVLPDSMLTVETAYTFNLTRPDTALAIIQTMRDRQAIQEWQADMIEGDLRYNLRQVRRAMPFFERAYAKKEIKDSVEVQMRLLTRLMDCCDILLFDGQLTEYIYELKQMALKTGDSHFLALSDFMAGKRFHFNGYKEEGYGFCLKSLKSMLSSTRPSKIANLRLFYAELVKMYTADKRYDEALKMSYEEEKWARQHSPLLILMADERALRRVYALRASLLARMGRMAEADKMFDEWTKTTRFNAIDDEEILDYLMLSHHDEQALDVAKNYRQFLKEQGDTVSYRMLSILNREAQIHLSLGQPEDAVMHGLEMGVISDSLRQRTSRNVMITTYDLLKQNEVSHNQTLFISVLAVIIIAFFAVGLMALYYTRIIRHRNKVLVKAFNGLDAYRRAILNGEPLSSPEVVAALEDVRTYSAEAGLTPEELEEPDDEDRRLFVEMDKQVTRDQLFLKPGLGRDDLMRLIGVDKNRFGKMMSKYSDASNTSVYINCKRVEFGARLLLEHPEYTIATIATECGMSNTVTFNRTFKDVYGITPSEYREKMKNVLNAENSQTT